MRSRILEQIGSSLLLLLIMLIVTPGISFSSQTDDRSWHMMTPAEFGFSSSVNALAVFKGDLVAAGGFAMAGRDTVNSVARWDGKQWRPLGRGMDAPVWCLCVYKGELVAGGEFRNAGGVAANGIARWDGTQWKPLGFGVRGVNKSEWVHVTTMTEYRGELVVGGRFSYAGGNRIQGMARWDGKTWQDMAYELAGDVRVIAVFKGQLISAGDVSEPSSGTVIQQFDGVDHWSLLGTGEPDDEVDAILPWGDSLIVAGKFSQVGGIDAVGLACWNGFVWKSLGAGLGQNVWCLASFGGKAVAAGANGAIAAWNGTGWENLGSGTNGDINSLLEYDQHLIVAGGFTRAGQVKVGRIAVWDTSAVVASEPDR